MGMRDAAAVGAHSDEQLRVLVLVAHGRDRELFAQQLADGYDVVTAAPDEEWPAFDLCLVDSDWYPEVATKLSGRRAAAEPVQLPVLLLLRGQASNTPWLSDALGVTVDDVVELPTGKLELDARVASLARDRKMSVALADQRDQLRLFQRAIDEAAVGISITDYRQPDNPIVYVNDRFTEITGYDEAAATGRNCRFLQGPETTSEPVAELRRAIDAGESTRVQLLNYRQDGSTFWNRLTVAPVRDEAGTITHFVGFQEDVTEELERERRYEAILDNADQFASLLEPDGTLVETNAAALEVIDDDREDVLGAFFPEAEWFDDNNRDVMADAIERAADGELVRGELDVELPDEVLTMVFTVKPVTGGDGEVNLLVAEARDITPLKERERELREEQAVTEAILDAVPDVFYMFDTEGTYVRWNDRFNEVTGCTDEVIDELGPFSFIPEPMRPRVAEELGAVAKDQPTATVQTEIVTLDGERIPYEFANARVEVDGELLGYAGIGRDVSDRVEREQELREERAFAESVFEGLPDVLYAFDHQGNFLRWNERLSDVTGYSQAEIPEMTPLDFIPEDQQANVAESMARVLERGETVTVESAFETKGGERIPYEFTGAPLVAQDGSELGLVGIGRDISERKARERELERFEAILKTAPDPVYALDTEGRFTLVNDAMVELLGRDRDTLVGSHASIVLSEEQLADGQEVVEALTESESGVETLELEVRNGEGTLRSLEINITLLTDEDGEVVGRVGVCRDMTDLRQSESRLSVFDRVLRHNLRNKMNIVLARAANIEAGAEDPESQAEAIRRAGEELLALSDRTREFRHSVSPESDTEPVDVAALVRRVADEYREQTTDATISVSAPDAAWVSGHETLEVALDELIENAITHHDSADPTVELRVSVADDRVTVAVADDGPGISELEQTALERGHETPLEHATGLGLWFVRWTVTNVGGEIDIRENEPRGSVVRLSLPRAKTSAETVDGSGS